MKNKIENVKIIGFIAYFFVIISFLIVIFYIQSDNNNLVYQISRNWLRKPIFDIYKENTSKARRNDFENYYDVSKNRIKTDSNDSVCVPLINNYFEGTERGCYCYLDLFMQLTRQYCRHDDHWCTDVYPISSIRYKIWDDTLLCVKKSHDTYFDMNIVSERNDCGLGNKECGYIDSFNNKLCVRYGESCPISNLIIKNKGINTNKRDNNISKSRIINNTEKFNFKEIRMSEHKTLQYKFDNTYAKNTEYNNNISNEDDIFQRTIKSTTNNYKKDMKANKLKNNEENNGNKYSKANDNNSLSTGDNDDFKLKQNYKIPIEFVIDENTPCVNQYYSNISPNHSLYKLDKKYSHSECKQINSEYTDEAFTLLDKTNYKDLLDENKILSELQNLPLFEVSDYDYPVNLYYKSYYGVKSNCHGDIKRAVKNGLLLEIGNKTSNNESQTTLSVLILIIDIALLIFLIVIFTNRKTDFYNVIIILCSLALKIIFLLILINNHYLENEVNNDLMDDNCVEGIVAYAFKNYYDSFEYIGNKFRLNLIFSIIMIVLYIFDYIINL